MVNYGYSDKADVLAAYEDLKKELGMETRFSLLFFSSSYPLETVRLPFEKGEMSKVVACTTSGELHPGIGLSKNSVVGISFDENYFLTETFEFPDLDNLDPQNNFPEKFSNVLEAHRQKKPGAQSFAILLIDGLSMKEERVVNYLAGILKEVPLIGASAGDDDQFKKTLVLVSGEFRSNTATLVLVSTDRIFETFKTDHFFPGDQNLVITSASPEKRIVHEIDGFSAKMAYAKALGIDPSEIGPDLFSANPLLLQLGSGHFIRGIQQVREDGSLVFYCAIDEGVILKVAKKKNLVSEMRQFFSMLDKKVGEDKMCLFFECTHRRQEILQLSEAERQELMELYKKNNVIGFHTYGEQYRGLHINQTLTGVAFGRQRR